MDILVLIISETNSNNIHRSTELQNVKAYGGRKCIWELCSPMHPILYDRMVEDINER